MIQGVYPVNSEYVSELGSFKVTVPGVKIADFREENTVPPKPMKFLAGWYFSRICKSLHSRFSFDGRQLALFNVLEVPHVSDFLQAAPIEGLGQKFSSRGFRAVLQYRLMLPIFDGKSLCSCCQRCVLDVMGDHALVCRNEPGHKFRHDLVRDGLYDVLWQAGIAARKELRFIS